ncbi:alpha-galactosidase [Gottfriedia solisilvae]|uniref:Alpha-galactosidase n=1 Tax=Gottfriedia solisilvae TaxID=1516104 RepID=A0A8J3ALD7_9BACI|nr:alpha-galactosidase [Gottfriedia solisilvae]GGI13037.1 alpha-galactosidase [Gottfriedia solisilvae]
MIIFDEKEKQFHLTNGQISYIFFVLKNGHLGSIYFGEALNECTNLSNINHHLYPNTYSSYIEGDRAFSLETLRQEYPVYGTTDYREPALSIIGENGSHISNFIYKYHIITKGKPILEGLPSTYTDNEEDAETIQIILEDTVLAAELILSYTIFTDLRVIIRSAYICNKGKNPFFLERFMSTSVDFPDKDFSMVQLSGAWARERYVKERRLETGIQSISSLRGASSHQHNPFLAFVRPDANETQGEVFSFNFIYSSNFIAQAEVDQFDCLRVTMGIHPFRFKWKLCSNEHFQSPEVVMVHSNSGLNGMSQTYHDLYRKHLIRGVWKEVSRPILLNNWEATYFHFNEKKLLEIAEASKELGIELFVLDDGWFGNRNDATSSLGDWFTNKSKFPNGIQHFISELNRLGLQFGLWFEPEMISPKSELYNNQPNWAINTPNRPTSLGRNQLVLDFSRKEIVDAIYYQIASIIEEANLSYIKWDMNRNITEAYSLHLAYDQQDEFFHRYILGVYDLYERLHTNFPHILIESCAGGGGRFDAGLLNYAPQAWASDDTDPIERLKIQYGSSFAYPLSSIGSHVSTSPNHQTLRHSSLKTRGNVAFFGTFGYELDPTTLSELEKTTIKNQIQFYKRHQSLIQYGDFYRIASPFKGNETAWMIVSKERDEALVGWYKVLATPNPKKYQYLKLTGLEKNYLYYVEHFDRFFYGDELMYHGIPLPPEFNGPNKKIAKRKGDFQSEVFYLKQKK